MGHAKLYAQAVGKQIGPKLRYNELLLRTRELEAYLDNETLPREDREAKIPEYKALLKALAELLEKIDGYTPEERIDGFFVNSVKSVNTNPRGTL
jgi:hypothetical protein